MSIEFGHVSVTTFAEPVTFTFWQFEARKGGVSEYPYRRRLLLLARTKVLVVQVGHLGKDTSVE